MAGLDFHALFDASPNPNLVLNRRLHIVGANLAYLAGVKRDLSDIVGHLAWDACPAPDEIVRQAVASVERVIRTKRTDVVSLLRFDVPCPEAKGGGFVERYWSVKHTPVLDAEGEVALVLQHPIDVAELQHVRDAVERNGLEAALNITPTQSGIVGRVRRTTTASTSSKSRTPPSRSGAPRGRPSRGQ